MNVTPEGRATSDRRIKAPGRSPGSEGWRRLACVLLLAGTVPVGLAWRFAPLGLPQFAFKYGGSALWAMGVYWLVAALLPRWRPAALAPLSAVIAAAVEFFKLVRSPVVDSFRDTLAGKVLIGRYFTFGAIVAYWLAIAAASLFDAYAGPGRHRRLT